MPMNNLYVTNPRTIRRRQRLAQVRAAEIRRLAAARVPRPEIARRLCVSVATVGRVLGAR